MIPKSGHRFSEKDHAQTKEPSEASREAEMRSRRRHGQIANGGAAGSVIRLTLAEQFRFVRCRRRLIVRRAKMHATVMKHLVGTFLGVVVLTQAAQAWTC